MKVQLLSDLHLEFEKNLYCRSRQIPIAADTVIICGDVCCGLRHGFISIFSFLFTMLHEFLVRPQSWCILRS